MPISAAQTTQNTQTAISERFPLESAVVVYTGGFLGIKDFLHATAANRGRADAYDASNGMLPLGISEGPHNTQDTSSATGNAAGTVDVGVKLEAYLLTDEPVAGVVSAADRLRYVYLTDDDVTANLTLTNNGNPVGLIVGYLTGTRCKVLLFGLVLQKLLAASGYGFREIPLGAFALRATAGNTGIQFEAQQRFLIVGWEASLVLSAGSGSPAIGLRVDDVAAHGSGERLSIVTGSAVGTRVESNVTESASLAVVNRGARLSVYVEGNQFGATPTVHVTVRVLYLGG